MYNVRVCCVWYILMGYVLESRHTCKELCDELCMIYMHDMYDIFMLCMMCMYVVDVIYQ